MEFKVGDKVSLIVGRQTVIGFTVLIDQVKEGILYKNELYQRVHEGDNLVGYVKKIRDDGKIDVSLQPIGFRQTSEQNTTKIHQLLLANEGYLNLNDKSKPDDIKYQVGMSKKAFKNAVGLLYKAKLITLEDTGIRLTKKGLDQA